MLKRIQKLSHNSTFRLVFLYFILFIFSSLILLSVIYWSSVSYIFKQLDHHIEYDMQRLQTLYLDAGKAKLVAAIEDSLQQKNYDSIYLLYQQDSQQILAGNLSAIPVYSDYGWHTLDLPKIAGNTTGVAHHNTPSKNHAARILIMPLPENLVFINGLDIDSAHQQKHMIFNALITVIVMVLLLGTIGGFIISINTIKKINMINNTITEIGKGNLTLRIPSRGSDDDYDLLAKNINQMLDQIQKLMQGMQNISNNIAHDLRTPLSRLRAHLEGVEHNAHDRIAAGIRDALTETDNLLSTFNAMLRINKLESGVQKGNFHKLKITRLLQDVVEFYAPLAEQKAIALTMSNTENRELYADRDMLFQVFANILDNAIKYTARKGNIHIRCTSIQHKETPCLQISLADNGIGIPENARKKVLEPFYRLAKHRDQQGNGLGLSLVAAIVKLHQGSIVLEDNKPGLQVIITLKSSIQH